MNPQRNFLRNTKRKLAQWFLSRAFQVDKDLTNDVRMAIRDLPNTKLALKAIANDYARLRLAHIVTPPPIAMPTLGMHSKACTQNDMESPWVSYWCDRLKRPIDYHRKTWENAYIMQMIYEHFQGDISRKTGIGFGCGEEPLPSVFISDGAEITVTDAPVEISGAWTSTGQHAASIDAAFHPRLVDEALFRKSAKHAFVDMNNIPNDLAAKFDFTWSVCAYEHLGSIERGIHFIDRTCDLLAPGGISVHTTEFNYDDGPTIDKGMTVLFQKAHFIEMGRRAAARGFTVAPLEFSVGEGVFDGYIDNPPFPWDAKGAPSIAHLKVGIGGFRSTCFGIAISRKP